MSKATSASDPLHLRTTLDSDFSFRNESGSGVVTHEPDSVSLAVSKEDWHNVSHKNNNKTMIIGVVLLAAGLAMHKALSIS